MIPKDFVDLHQHVLWGIDDGPKTAEEMHALLEADAENGIKVVAATSHALPGIRPFDLTLYKERVSEAREYCKEKKLPIRIISGAEIYFTPLALPMLLDSRIPTIGDSEYVLLEFDGGIDRKNFDQTINQFFRSGLIPIVAHIERYKLSHYDLNHMIALKQDVDVRYQINCDLVLSDRLQDKLFLHRLLKAQAADLIATDAHNTRSRPPHIKKAYKRICEEQKKGYELFLFEDSLEIDMPGITYNWYI